MTSKGSIRVDDLEGVDDVQGSMTSKGRWPPSMTSRSLDAVGGHDARERGVERDEHAPGAPYWCSPIPTCVNERLRFAVRRGDRCCRAAGWRSRRAGRRV